MRFKEEYVRQFDVSARKTMNFAAAIKDGNDLYYNDSEPEKFTVHPMFAVAVTWPSNLYMLEQDYEGLPENFLYQLVHVEEELTFFRTLKPGETIEIRSHMQEPSETTTGTIVSVVNEAMDAKGERVFSEVARCFVFREAEDSPSRAKKPALPNESSGTGEPDWSVEVPSDPLLAHVYDGCSGISHPIHTSRSFARGFGLDFCIIHGTATLSRAVSIILETECRNDPANLKQLKCRFRNVVKPEDRFTLQMRRAGREEGRFEARAGDTRLLLEGHATWSL